MSSKALCETNQYTGALIDLHAHTDQSDGSSSPASLIQEAIDANLEALAVTDHDTLAGYDLAAPIAREKGLEAVCGIELSTRLDRNIPGKRAPSVHLLGYFVHEPPTQAFRDWLIRWQESRRERNRKLIQRLNDLGVDIQIEEVQRIGRNLTGRPHFARVLVDKGYVSNTQEAFDKYLGENASAGVDREECSLDEAIRMVREAGGAPVLAHPCRLPQAHDEQALSQMIETLIPNGLQGIEVWYSEHSPEERGFYLGLANRFGLIPTGGSDYHGTNKPGISLGTGRGKNLAVPYAVLQSLRQQFLT
jgi:predicted metal-dependent phosphoesterase TrpH